MDDRRANVALEPSKPDSARTKRASGDRVQRVARRQPVALVALGVFLYSTGPVLVRMSSLSGPAFSFWRLVLGVPVLAVPMLVYERMGGGWPDRGAWRWAIWGGLAFGLHQFTFMSALKATSVTDVTLMGTLSPVITAVLAARLLDERPGTRFHLWTALAMVGATIVIIGGSAGPEGDAAGMATAAVSVALLSAFFLISKMSRAEIDVLPFLLGSTAVAVLPVAAFVWFTGEPLLSASGRDLWLTFVVALVPGGMGHFMTTWPLRWIPANVPALMQLAMPLIAGLLAWWLLGEGITWAHVIGGVITLVGVCGAILSPAGRPARLGAPPH